jgi:hypothetical protein
MFLLITSCDRAQECAKAIEEATSEAVEVAASLVGAAERLRSGEYSAIVIDQFLLEAEPDEGEVVLEHAGGAIPVQVNLAISGIERVVRELRSALQRRDREVVVARKEAQRTLRNELKDTVTALLLSCEMALQLPELSEIAHGKLNAVYELAKEMGGRLGAQG